MGTEVGNFLAFLGNERNIFHGSSKSSENRYTPRSVIARYFTDGSGSLDTLLREVLKEEEHIPQAEVIIRQHLTLLTVLISIGKGEYLNRCIERDYTDDRLPLFDRPRNFPKSETGSFFDTFFDAQWRYCPAKITKNPVNFQIEPEQILPLKSKMQISKDATSTTYLVEVFDEYDTLRKNTSIFEIDIDIGKPTNHTYLFKEFEKSSKAAYDKELTGFLHLQKSGQLLGKSVTDFYGSFIHDETRTIVLEYADHGTLDTFMSTMLPPTSAEDITRLWESMLKLHDALHLVHNMSVTYSAEIKEHTMLRGWHQSLCPKHISVVSGETDSDYDCQFRIANIGTLEDIAEAKAYAAPECTSHNPDVNLQMADIFSLGCIYSEFSVWISTGLTGLTDFREDRQQELEARGLQIDSTFHDGQNVLDSVAHWNNVAIEDKSFEDRMTEGIIQQLVEDMLCEDGDARPTTRQLKAKINKILGRAREQYLADLRRADSVASNSTGYSSVGLSSKGRLSYRDSVRSDSSSGRLPNQGLRQLDRSGTTRSTNTSPSIIDENKQTYFNSAHRPQPLSPASSTGTPASPATQMRSYLASMEPAIDGSDAPEPIPLRIANRTTPVAFSNVSAALLNGDDKEIVISRGPMPAALRPRPVGETVSPPLLNPVNDVTSPITSAGNDLFDHRMSMISPVVPDVTQSEQNVPGLDNVRIEIMPDNDPRAASFPPPAAFLNSELSRSQSTMSHLTVRGTPDVEPNVGLTRAFTMPMNQPLTKIQPAPKNKVYKPNLTLDEGTSWLVSKKLSTTDNKNLRDIGYLAQLADRDFLFLIDDSLSTRASKDNITRCVRLMAWLLKQHDKNGMDLYFMNKAGKTHTRPGHSSDLQKPMLKALDDCKGKSNANTRLSQILTEYRDRANGGKARKLMIYAFSDGNWEAGSEEKLISTIDAIESAMGKQGGVEKAVGLQLVRAAENNNARFETIAAGRRNLNACVVVDTVPLGRNVYRTMLGPIVDLWDDSETDEIGTMSSYVRSSIVAQ